MADIATVLESYADYLGSKSKRLRARFATTLRNNAEAAIAEAVTFGALQQCGARPVSAGMLNIGGPDFLCLGGSPDQFMVEATSFTPEKFTKDTGLEIKGPEDIHAVCPALEE